LTRCEWRARRAGITLGNLALLPDHWRSQRTDNSLQRVMGELRRRTRGACCFSDAGLLASGARGGSEAVAKCPLRSMAQIGPWDRSTTCRQRRTGPWLGTLRGLPTVLEDMLGAPALIEFWLVLRAPSAARSRGAHWLVLTACAGPEGAERRSPGQHPARVQSGVATSHAGAG
jgi:hypothetical protein